MCRFMSAIVNRKGEIFTHDLTDSHSDLIAHFGLHEGKRGVVKDANFVKLEFTPADDADGNPIHDAPEKYTLAVDDGDYRPKWLDETLWATVEKYLRDRVERMIVRDKRSILLGGAWIIAKGASVEVSRDCRIVSLCGGTISEVRGGTISAVWGGTISEVRGGTISAVCGGTILAVWGGTISEVWGGTISEVRGGTILAVWGGTISEVRGGTISAVWGGTISEVRGGTISAVWGGTISEVRGGTISAVWGGTISAVWGGTISEVGPYAKVSDEDRKKIKTANLAKANAV
jgi:hypothetical protein